MPKPLNYVHTYYDIQVVDSEIREMKGFIDQVPDSWYRPNQLSYEDKDRDIYIEKYRSCGILFSLDEESVFHRVGRQIFYAINTMHFEYDLSDKFEFQILKYKPGGHYEWHIDYGSCAHSGLDRKLSMSIQLSDENEYEGGELEIISAGHKDIKAGKALGSGIVFDSKVTHRAKPVTKGERIVLVGWAAGPKLR